MLRHRKLAIASVACAAAALALTPAVVAKPKKTKFKTIGETVVYAGSVFNRAELTTPSFTPGPNGKLKISVNGAVSHDPAGHGSQGHVSGTLTCKKGDQEMSASTDLLTYYPFETTYKTSVTGIKDPKRCVLTVAGWWDPVVDPVGLLIGPNWPHGNIELTVRLKK